jgi:Mrp family chromosome partitioning ATPase
MNGGTIVLLTGSQHGVGCTTVALALATAAAREHSVLLIDGDQSNRRLSTALENQTLLGWDDALGSGSLNRVLCYPDVGAGVAFLPLRQVRPEPFIAKEHTCLAQWKTQFRQEYGLILVDGGSVWHNGAGWASWVDVSLVVCDSGQKLADDWALAWDRLEEANTRILGIIETLS